MFTGLVEGVGAVVACTPTAGGSRLRIESDLAREIAEGASVAVNGVCLTAIEADGAEIRADLGPETLRATTLGSLGRGALVNLERPLRADGRVGGHFVQGHVDAVGRIDDVRLASEFSWVAVSFPPELAPYIVHKGSIAVDGISLTVAALETGRFEVQIVPFTLANTNLRQVRVGDRVNLECDLIGKYVVRALAASGLPPSSPAHGRT